MKEETEELITCELITRIENLSMYIVKRKCTGNIQITSGNDYGRIHYERDERGMTSMSFHDLELGLERIMTASERSYETVCFNGIWRVSLFRTMGKTNPRQTHGQLELGDTKLEALLKLYKKLNGDLDGN